MKQTHLAREAKCCTTSARSLVEVITAALAVGGESISTAMTTAYHRAGTVGKDRRSSIASVDNGNLTVPYATVCALTEELFHTSVRQHYRQETLIANRQMSGVTCRPKDWRSAKGKQCLRGLTPSKTFGWSPALRWWLHTR